MRWLAATPQGSNGVGFVCELAASRAMWVGYSAFVDDDIYR
jgi:hypothetical protein